MVVDLGHWPATVVLPLADNHVPLTECGDGGLRPSFQIRSRCLRRRSPPFSVVACADGPKVAGSNAMAEVRITSPHDGDVLSFHDGHQTETSLRLTVSGVAPPQSQVTLNGLVVNADAGRWSAEVELTEFRNELVVTGGRPDEHRIVVYWDRHSCRRYRYSTDDNIYWLRDLARHVGEYRSLFDQPYLAFWRGLHDRYGLRVQHNIYWSEPEGFDLTQMPECYQAEFQDNADWLRLTFHAEQNDPAKPYLTADYETVARDYDKVTEQIVRFAGESSLCYYTTVHWGEATFEGCRALRDRGMLGLAGYFYTDPQAAPGLETAQVGYYLSAEQCRHLAARDAWKCHRGDLWFIKHDVVCNTMPPERIRPHLDSVFANPHRRQIMEAMIHEQYFCEFLPNYQPDVKQRVIEAVEWLAEHDYQPIFYDEGFLGAPHPEGGGE